jgi:uncharacterized protein YgbK (DUF1537 family)
LFFDAETDSDLEAVAEAVLKNSARYLPVGSSGFLRAIANVLGNGSEARLPFAKAKERCSTEQVLFVCGSRSNISRRQAAELERTFGVKRVPTVGEAARSINGGSRLAIACSPTHEVDEQDRESVLPNLLMGTNVLLEVTEMCVFVTGGATAAALLGHLTGYSYLEILGEFEPGVVAARAIFDPIGNTGRPPLNLVLKAGGFGDDFTMTRLSRIVGLCQ